MVSVRGRRWPPPRPLRPPDGARLTLSHVDAARVDSFTRQAKQQAAHSGQKDGQWGPRSRSFGTWAEPLAGSGLRGAWPQGACSGKSRLTSLRGPTVSGCLDLTHWTSPDRT